LLAEIGPGVIWVFIFIAATVDVFVIYIGIALWATLRERHWGEVKSNPSVSGNTVYIGSDDDKVYPLVAAAGRLRWSRTTQGLVGWPGGIAPPGSHRTER